MGTSISDLITPGISSKYVSKMDDMTTARNMFTEYVRAWESAA